MPIPEATRKLVIKLRRAATLLDAVAMQTKTDRSYVAAAESANAIWLAIQRIEDMATAIEDMAPTFAREPDDSEEYARTLNNL